MLIFKELEKKAWPIRVVDYTNFGQVGQWTRKAVTQFLNL